MTFTRKLHCVRCVLVLENVSYIFEGVEKAEHVSYIFSRPPPKGVGIIYIHIMFKNIYIIIHIAYTYMY